MSSPDISKIEELCFVAADAENTETLEKLMGELRSLDNLSDPVVAAGLEFLLEAWGDSIDSSDAKSEFCLNLAVLAPPDTPILRVSLQKALSKLRKSDFLKSALVKATGVRDAEVNPAIVVDRFYFVESLAPGVLLYNRSTLRFGEVDQLDSMTSEISIRWSGTSSVAVVTLEAAARDMIAFKIPAKDAALPDLTSKKNALTSEEWRKKLRRAAATSLDDKLLRSIAVALADASETPHDILFEWWNGASESNTSAADRHPSKARSLHELHFTLGAFGQNEMSGDELKEMKKTLESLHFKSSPSETKLLAESLAMLSETLSPIVAAELCASIAPRVPFWPENPADSADLSPWSSISVKHLSSLAELTSLVFSLEYLAELIQVLPIRCWNAITSVTGIDIVASSLKNVSCQSSDTLLWIWKNKTQISAELQRIVTIQAVAGALKKSETSPAGNQLKKLFIYDTNLHKAMLGNVPDDDMMGVLYAVQACDSLRLDEKQSLLVKLSALSPELKKLLESGEGEKLFSEVSKKHLAKQKEDEPKISSRSSMAALSATLKVLVEKQIPENAAAIAHARSYGDLKENAEYKAAKERQAFLNRRAAEVETAVNETQPFDFSTVEPTGEAVPGSTVVISIDGSAEKEKFHLLGAWDGAPELNRVAYTSALGMILKGKYVGERLKLPDGRQAVIESVSKLPDNVLRDLQ